MSDLSFGDGSWEDARGVVKTVLNELHNIIKGNGKEGMQETLNSLVTTIEATEKTRQEFQNKRDQEIKDALEAHNRRYNLLIGLVTLILLGVQIFYHK
jgi:hypothetical protein